MISSFLASWKLNIEKLLKEKGHCPRRKNSNVLYLEIIVRSFFDFYTLYQRVKRPKIIDFVSKHLSTFFHHVPKSVQTLLFQISGCLRVAIRVGFDCFYSTLVTIGFLKGDRTKIKLSLLLYVLPLLSKAGNFPYSHVSLTRRRPTPCQCP